MGSNGNLERPCAPLEPELCFEHRKKEGIARSQVSVTEHLTRWPNITESSLSTLSARSLVGCQQGHAASEDTREERFFPFPLLLVALVYIHMTPSSASSSWPSSCPPLDFQRSHQLCCLWDHPTPGWICFCFFFPIFMYVCVHV